MAALTADKVLNFDPSVSPLFADIQVKSATTIYQGTICTDDGGNGEADHMAASENFIGIAEKQVVNPASGTLRAKMRTRGVLKNVKCAGLDANTDYGVAVYAVTSNPDDLTLTSSTAYVQIGKVISYNGQTGYGDVYFEALVVRSI